MYIQAKETKNQKSANGSNDHFITGGMSFKKRKEARKKARMKRQAYEKGRLSCSAISSLPLKKTEKKYSGPTEETKAKLKADPLVRFRNKNILNDQQISAFQCIRRAIQLITDGTSYRVSQLNGIVVQTSRNSDQYEKGYEIKLKDRYNIWVDLMTSERLQLGPVLDVIIDELSLSAVDRKWGRRKGWAKIHLQASLDLFGVSISSRNRYK